MLKVYCKLVFFILLSISCVKSQKKGLEDAITEILWYNLNVHLKPSTLRVVEYSSFPRGESIIPWEKLREMPKVVGKNRPLMRSASPKMVSTRHVAGIQEVFHYVVVIWMDDYGQIVNSLKHIGHTVNTRFDRLVVIGPGMVLNRIMRSDEVKIMKEKYAIDSENGEIWTSKLNDFEMIKISESNWNSVLEEVFKKRYGYVLNGRHLRATSVDWPPAYFFYGSSKKNDSKPAKGNHLKLLEEAQQLFNFTISVLGLASDEYDGVLDNGTRVGMFASVLYPELNFDIALQIGHLNIYNDYVDTTHLLHVMYMSFFTAPPTFKIKWYSILLPFTITLWIFVVATFFIVIVAIIFIVHFYQRKSICSVLSESFVPFLPITLALEQGLSDITKGARGISLVWLLGCMVLGTGYKSTLRSNLAFPKPEAVPTTFKELAESDYKVTMIVDGPEEVEFLEKNTNPSILKLRDTIEFSKSVIDATHDVLRYDKHAFISYNPRLQYIISQKYSVNRFFKPIISSKDSCAYQPIGLGLVRDSMYSDAMVNIVSASMASGLTDKWGKDDVDYVKKLSRENFAFHNDSWIYERIKKMESDQLDVSNKPLVFKQLRAIFLLLLLGLGISLLIFLLEFYHRKFT